MHEMNKINMSRLLYCRFSQQSCIIIRWLYQSISNDSNVLTLKSCNNYVLCKDYNWTVHQSTDHTFVTEIIHHHNLMQQLRRRSINDAVNSSYQRRKSFIVKYNNDTGCRQSRRVMPVLASVHKWQYHASITNVSKTARHCCLGESKWIRPGKTI